MSPVASPLNGPTGRPDLLSVRRPSITAASEQLLPSLATTGDGTLVDNVAYKAKKSSQRLRFGKVVFVAMSLFGLGQNHSSV
jgi:hypothetical protein